MQYVTGFVSYPVSDSNGAPSSVLFASSRCTLFSPVVRFRTVDDTTVVTVEYLMDARCMYECWSSYAKEM